MTISVSGGEIAGTMVKGAVLAGRHNEYRYELGRSWDLTKPVLVVCMFNPSTADAERDDPTVKTLIHFATLWGYGGLRIVNLFAFRTSKPAELLACDARFGPENGRYVAEAMDYAAKNGGRLLVAWGNGGELDGRGDWFCLRAGHVYKLDLICLGLSRGSRWVGDIHHQNPKHPMARGKHRIPRDQKPIMYLEAYRGEA